MTKQGKTTGNLKMRSGPGMQFEPPIAYLVPDTALEILGEEGDWWKVRAAGKEGYVGKKYVAVTEVATKVEPTAEGAREAADATKGQATAARPIVKPSAPKGIAVDAGALDADKSAKPEAKPSAPKTKNISTTVKPVLRPGSTGGGKKK